MAKKTIVKREVVVEINPYELVLILNPELRESEVKKKLKEITDMIEKAGGKITHEDFWGRKELAYRIKANGEGIYMVYNLELPNNFIAELRSALRIEKEVLRSLILKLPADYTYTKFDLEAPEEESKERERRPKSYAKKSEEKNISIKHNAPVTPEKPKEETKEEVVEDTKEEPEAKEEVKEEKKPEEKKSKKKEEVDESELDKKLDAILEGDDLNL